MPPLSRADRTRLWNDRLNRHARSGRTIAAFCLDEGIAVASFYQWKRKLAQQKSQASPSPTQSPKDQTRNKAFAEVAIVGNQSANTTIELPGDIRITLGTDQQTVATIVQQLLPTVSPPIKGASC